MLNEEAYNEFENVFNDTYDRNEFNMARIGNNNIDNIERINYPSFNTMVSHWNSLFNKISFTG